MPAIASTFCDRAILLECMFLVEVEWMRSSPLERGVSCAALCPVVCYAASLCDSKFKLMDWVFVSSHLHVTGHTSSNNIQYPRAAFKGVNYSPQSCYPPAL